MKYNKEKSFVQNIMDASTIIAFIFMISGAFSSAAFFYLDFRNDQRYLKLVEITTKLDPLYISIASAKEQQRIEDIRNIRKQIFDLEFKRNTLAKQGKTLEPYAATILSQDKEELAALLSQGK